jgi:arsenite-transporting ATPase
MHSLLQKKIVFFGGKGGVGKSTSASATALYASTRGLKTLLVSTDPAHNTGDIFNQKIGRKEKCISDGLYALEIDPQHESHLYINRVKENLREIVQPQMLQEIEKQIDIAHASPGADEAALFDRIVEIIEEGQNSYDLIIFDTAPTGHTLRLLSLPELMGVWIEGMLQRRQKANELHRMWMGEEEDPDKDPIYEILMKRKNKFVKAREILLDAKITAFVFVLNPEKLPILETEKAVQTLEKYGVPTEYLVVNRVLPEEVQDPFLVKRKEQERKYMKTIEEFFPKHEKVYVPMLEEDIHGIESLHIVKNYLFPEWEMMG